MKSDNYDVTFVVARPVSKEVVEVPLIFTKPAASSSRPIQYLHTKFTGDLPGQNAGDRGEREREREKREEGG